MQENRTIYEILLQENKKQEVADLVSFNEKTESFGLSLSPKEAGELAACRNESLRKWRRVEFGQGILKSLIWTFCDSPYLNQDNYAETLRQLQDIFYEFKNETSDRMTDQELLISCGNSLTTCVLAIPAIWRKPAWTVWQPG